MADTRKMKTSNLWTCFEDLGDSVNKVACCKICKVKLSYKSSTTNLKKKHLERKHPTIQFMCSRSCRSTPQQPGLDINIHYQPTPNIPAIPINHSSTTHSSQQEPPLVKNVTMVSQSMGVIFLFMNLDS